MLGTFENIKVYLLIPYVYINKLNHEEVYVQVKYRRKSMKQAWILCV